MLLFYLGGSVKEDKNIFEKKKQKNNRKKKKEKTKSYLSFFTHHDHHDGHTYTHTHTFPSPSSPNPFLPHPPPPSYFLVLTLLLNFSSEFFLFSDILRRASPFPPSSPSPITTGLIPVGLPTTHETRILFSFFIAVYARKTHTKCATKKIATTTERPTSCMAHTLSLSHFSVKIFFFFRHSSPLDLVGRRVVVFSGCFVVFFVFFLFSLTFD